VRLEAIKALKLIGGNTETTIPILIKRLHDEDNEVRIATALALNALEMKKETKKKVLLEWEKQINNETDDKMKYELAKHALYFERTKGMATRILDDMDAKGALGEREKWFYYSLIKDIPNWEKEDKFQEKLSAVSLDEK
jgi:hypothetical protein